MNIKRRKRLADGSFGPLESVSGGLSELEKENMKLRNKIEALDSQIKLQDQVMVEIIDVIFNGFDRIEEENKDLEIDETVVEELEKELEEDKEAQEKEEELKEEEEKQKELEESPVEEDEENDKEEA